MTYCLESYKDRDGLVAHIEQDKYSSCYRLDVVRMIDECRGQTVFKGTYVSIPNARRAMRKQMTAPVTKTYDFYDDHKKEEM